MGLTPQEKAKELVDKFKNIVNCDYTFDEEPIFELQKEAALIVVNEIIEQSKDANYGGFKLYWEAVKQEIEKL